MKSPTMARPVAAATLLLAAITACNSGAVDPPDVNPPPSASPSATVPPMPTNGRHTVSGEVFAFETGMIGGADINLWIQTPGFGFSYWWARGPLRSDDVGLFEAVRIPDSSITLLAFKDGYLQPCAVTAAVAGDVAVRIEMVPRTSLDTLNAPRPQLSGEVSLSGMIYEVTKSGRQPVPGASLWAEYPSMIGAANTVSDRGGGYFLCNLEVVSELYISKAGYETRILGPIVVEQSPYLEIELERL